MTDLTLGNQARLADEDSNDRIEIKVIDAATNTLWPLSPVGSTDCRNTRGKLFSWRLILQGFTGPLIELSCDGTEFGLRMNGKVRSVP